MAILSCDWSIEAHSRPLSRLELRVHTLDLQHIEQRVVAEVRPSCNSEFNNIYIRIFPHID